MCSPISNPDAPFESGNLIRYDDANDAKIDESLSFTSFNHGETEDGDLNVSKADDPEDFIWAVTGSGKSSVESVENDGVIYNIHNEPSNFYDQLTSPLNNQPNSTDIPSSIIQNNSSSSPKSLSRISSLTRLLTSSFIVPKSHPTPPSTPQTSPYKDSLLPSDPILSPSKILNTPTDNIKSDQSSPQAISSKSSRSIYSLSSIFVTTAPSSTACSTSTSPLPPSRSAWSIRGEHARSPQSAPSSTACSTSTSPLPPSRSTWSIRGEHARSPQSAPSSTACSTSTSPLPPSRSAWSIRGEHARSPQSAPSSTGCSTSTSPLPPSRSAWSMKGEHARSPKSGEQSYFSISPKVNMKSSVARETLLSYFSSPGSGHKQNDLVVNDGGEVDEGEDEIPGFLSFKSTKGFDKDGQEDEDHGGERKEAEDGDLNVSEGDDPEDFIWAVSGSGKSSVESAENDGVTVVEEADTSIAIKDLFESQVKERIRNQMLIRMKEEKEEGNRLEEEEITRKKLRNSHSSVVMGCFDQPRIEGMTMIGRCIDEVDSEDRKRQKEKEIAIKSVSDIQRMVMSVPEELRNERITDAILESGDLIRYDDTIDPKINQSLSCSVIQNNIPCNLVAQTLFNPYPVGDSKETEDVRGNSLLVIYFLLLLKFFCTDAFLGDLYENVYCRFFDTLFSDLYK
jgi:hypothetical protein